MIARSAARKSCADALYSLAAVDRSGVMDPFDLELAVAHQAQHFQRVRAARSGLCHGPVGFGREAEELRAGHHLVELAEIIEEQLRTGASARGRRAVWASSQA